MRSCEVSEGVKYRRPASRSFSVGGSCSRERRGKIATPSLPRGPAPQARRGGTSNLGE